MGTGLRFSCPWRCGFVVEVLSGMVAGGSLLCGRALGRSHQKEEARLPPYPSSLDHHGPGP